MNGLLKLTPGEQRLAQATKRAIQAAGGLEVCESETGISTSQLSRCQSPNHRDSITVRDAVRIEGIGNGQPGHPHILAAMAGQLGFVVIALPGGGDDPEGLLSSVMELTKELGDVAGVLHEALKDRVCKPSEAEDALEQLDDLDRASARLRIKLKGIAAGEGR